jgi:hypothetical protein
LGERIERTLCDLLEPLPESEWLAIADLMLRLEFPWNNLSLRSDFRAGGEAA